MKTFGIFVVLVAGMLADTYCYSTAHDDLDIDAIVADKDKLRSFLDCFADNKHCNELTLDIKKKMPEVIQEACAKCSPTQRKKFKTFLDGMNEKLPTEFADFKKKFDPSGKLFAALDAELAKA